MKRKEARPPPPPRAPFCITLLLRLLPPLRNVFFSFPSFSFVRIDRAPLVVFFDYASAPSLYLFFFYSGSFLYDFNGQDLLSVSESDSSHPLLFFFFFVVVRSQYFSLRGHVQNLFFQPQRTIGSIFEEELLSLDWAFSVSCIFPAIFIFLDKDIFEVKGQQNE
jgi:hypothetical protein